MNKARYRKVVIRLVNAYATLDEKYPEESFEFAQDSFDSRLNMILAAKEHVKPRVTKREIRYYWNVHDRLEKLFLAEKNQS